MPIRKKGNIDIRTSAKGAQATQTGYTFYSYDKNSAALYFQFRGQDGQPTDLGKATIHLVMILNDDGGKEFIPKSDEIEVISAIRGTAKYVLPEMLLSYSGEVTGYVYMDFDDGSQSDDGQFTFRIKQSMITHVLPKVGDKYVQDFEDVKERVEQAGDSATKDIEKSKDNAESQIGDYVGEVEKDYKEWKEKQEDKQSKFEADTDERVNNITERVGEAENKASDLESNLDVAQKNYFSIRDWQKRPDFTVPTSGIPAIKIKLTGNEEYTLSSNIEPRTNDSANIFLTYGNKTTVNSGANGVYPGTPKTLTTQSDGYVMVAIRDDIDVTDNDVWIMLNKGGYDAKWTPHTNDIVTIQQYNKLEQAVIELGGSI
ncbi:BppU family phage baseplate upper protein [Tetragenococcus halophilus]|uniref:BppU family phage baseplate upper protein n=1 Tax=Tetragenococcus halophilus TaxID=51669 RepID=UPI0015BCF99B|nr:BppU family phage baseplate upper protein [Tetragenococcus halophilus]